jgi:hypothetical protein
MSQIEEELHSLLRTKVDQAPVREEPPRVVLSHARRRRARNVVSACAAIALVAFGIVGLNVVGTDRTVVPLEPPTVVPWAPVPFEGTAPLHDPPACRADDLDFVPLSEGPGSIGFRPKDPRLVCLMASSFELRVLDQTGRDLGVEVVRGSSLSPAIYVEKPERVTAFFFKWETGCTPITDPITYVVTLAEDGGTLQADAPAVKTPCDVARTPVLQLLDEGTLAQPDIRVLTIADLDLELSSLPASVRRGTTLRYQVTLTNSTMRRTISLDPCPGFEQSISSGDSDVIAIHLLNCDEAPSELAPAEVDSSGEHETKPGDAVTFAMELSIPTDFPLGDARLAWRLFGREDLPSTAFVEITS